MIDIPDNEATLVSLFLLELRRHRDARLPPLVGDHETIIREYPLRYGRADLVIFHNDGTATVVEAKLGAKGYNHVVAGIGQASLYAAQLAAGRGAVTRVHRALLGTSTKDIDSEVAIELACQGAGVIALPFGPMERHLAACSVNGLTHDLLHRYAA